MRPFELLIAKRPVSLQTKRRKNLQAWKNFVRTEAAKVWNADDPPVGSPFLRCIIVYLCDNSPADIDNIIKPIQDALVGLVFEDDFLVSDVDSHRRFLADTIDVTSLPLLLQAGVAKGEECVYVRISDAQDLRNYL
ncbi:RusA family crossover junction endodeoxyribonuclease [Rugamonas sp. CCM 8940]|uniref:RusA family crossover junction endodeoxyribonuclease n=1 Tax=Rugamonas sp. CCM 8940 TaxID=2765359 RepID=UPI0018F37330|nr:RusA family crossover junction endodeoxyribonuclease [Rugamonas sp. CCM 8940]MBJ7312675.1 RusA family crossover junction endodeoxyribonuclease [Rugamonas sp. CCM 8940]